MKYEIIIHPEAERDIHGAYEWYESKKNNLGKDLVIELQKLFLRISDQPDMFQKSYQGLSRALPHRFPYAVYFFVKDNTILIRAVLHQRNNPDRLQK